MTTPAETKKTYKTNYIIDSKGNGQHMYRVIDVVTDRSRDKVKNWIRTHSNKLARGSDGSWYGPSSAFGRHWRKELAPAVREEPVFKRSATSEFLPVSFDDGDAHVRLASAAVVPFEEKKAQPQTPTSTPELASASEPEHRVPPVMKYAAPEIVAGLSAGLTSGNY